MIIFFIAYIICGIAIGLLAGLLGIGGGVLGIPALLTLFDKQGLSQNVAMHMAVGTSLAIVALTGMASAYTHNKKGAVNVDLFKRFAPGAVVGCILGIVIASHLQSSFLQKLFGIFLLVIAAQMLWKQRIKYNPMQNEPFVLPSRVQLFSASTLFGALSGILGIGGGAFMIPYFNWCGVPIRNAVATSAACLLPVAIVGTIGYVITGSSATGLPALSTGFLYWPAFLAVGIASMVCAPFGARLAHAIPSSLLHKIFACFLMILGIKMLW